MVHIFKELSEPECVKNYVSNQRTWEKDGWRYKKNHTHYTLEYRIVTSQSYAIKVEGNYHGTYRNGLSINAHDFINDIRTIAHNLGFRCSPWDHSYNREWESNQAQEFKCVDGATEPGTKNHIRPLMIVRAFKNGNVHFKFDQKFIKTLNIEAARLLKWIKTPQEAVDEMGVDIGTANERFNSNMLLCASDGQKLLMG